MTDEQCIALMSALLFRPGEGAPEAVTNLARSLFLRTRALGPLPARTLAGEPQKAVISRATIGELNEAHEARSVRGLRPAQD